MKESGENKFEEYQQSLIDAMIQNKVTFKYTLGDADFFNLFINNDIIKVVLKDNVIQSCLYMYRNLLKEQDKWVYDDLDFNFKTINGQTCIVPSEEMIVRDELLIKRCWKEINDYLENPLTT